VQLCQCKPEDAVSFMVEHLTAKYLKPIPSNTTTIHIEPLQPEEKEADFKSARVDGRPSNIRSSREILRTSNSRIYASPSPTRREIQDERDSHSPKEFSSPEPSVPKRVLERRNAFSSEHLSDISPVLPHHPKTRDESEILNDALDTHIMFAHLEEEERQAIFDAMFQVKFSSGTVIIRQGDEADYFYVVADGQCDIEITKDGKTHHVATVEKDGSFGELSLIYLCPRAATVTAKTDVTLWAIDRKTYRQVLLHSVTEKRKMYESFLEKVPILQQLTSWERMTVADALETYNFQDDETIIREGDVGDIFYIIVEGDAEVFHNSENGMEQIATLHKSDYFGEVALLMDRPRSATVVAVNALKCVGLDRERFSRLLGPCEDILRRNMENYNHFMASRI